MTVRKVLGAPYWLLKRLNGLRVRASSAVNRAIPFCPAWDRLFALRLFLLDHKRWPRRYLFNDRLFRLKWDGEMLDPLRQFVSDKVLAKDFIRGRVGQEHVVPTLAVLRTEKDVHEYDFPVECVVKITHGTRGVKLVRDGAIDRAEVASWLRIDHYREGREQNYAFMRPGVIVEPFVFGGGVVPEDIKMFCVDGVPKGILVDYDRFTGQTRVLYDTNWNPLPYRLSYPMGIPRPRPANLDQMLEAAAALSLGFSFIRVDFFSDGTDFKVGEITNCHANCRHHFIPPEAEHDFSFLLFGPEQLAGD